MTRCSASVFNNNVDDQHYDDDDGDYDHDHDNCDDDNCDDGDGDGDSVRDGKLLLWTVFC